MQFASPFDPVKSLRGSIQPFSRVREPTGTASARLLYTRLEITVASTQAWEELMASRSTLIRAAAMSVILSATMFGEGVAGPEGPCFIEGQTWCEDNGCFLQPYPHYEVLVWDCNPPYGWMGPYEEWVDPEDHAEFMDNCGGGN
jgi:hypothetical protein